MDHIHLATLAQDMINIVNKEYQVSSHRVTTIEAVLFIKDIEIHVTINKRIYEEIKYLREIKQDRYTSEIYLITCVTLFER